MGRAARERNSSGSFWHRRGRVTPKAGGKHCSCNAASLRITVVSALECDRWWESLRNQVRSTESTYLPSQMESLSQFSLNSLLSRR